MIILHRGAVIAMGTPGELKENSAIYRRLLASTQVRAADTSSIGAASWDF